MEDFSRSSRLARAAGISRSYASEMIRGIRQPSRDLAISIFRKTGRKFPPIAELTDAEIDVLENLLRKVA